MTPVDLGDAIMAGMTIAALVTMAMALYWQRGHARYERQDTDAYIAMEQALTSQQRRTEQQAARIDELERQRMSDHNMIIDLRNKVAALEAYVATLVRQLQDNGIAPAALPVALASSPAPVDKRQLAQRIAALFDMDEMATLMFDIGIDDEALAGRTRAARARELVDYAERHGQLDVLAAAVNASRPDIKS